MNRVISPRWDAPSCIRALTTTRIGGVGHAPYDSFNLAAHVGDDPDVVATNRGRLFRELNIPTPIKWVNQVHGSTIIDAEDVGRDPPDADALYTTKPNTPCAILTADCLPIVLADSSGTEVAAVHAGWRGLRADIIARAVARFRANTTDLHAWLGPGIGANAYAVGDELRVSFTQWRESLTPAFEKHHGQWHANLAGIATSLLNAAGVGHVTQYQGCTYDQSEAFFSYRRDGETGRMATIIWIDA